MSPRLRRPNPHFTIQERKLICTRYVAGESSLRLAAEFGVWPSSIRRLLQRKGITRRHDTAAHRVFQCDYRFFERIDTEHKAYWLGFISADGSVSYSFSQLKISIAIKDREHLERFKESINSNHNIKEYLSIGSIRGRVKRDSPQCRVVITSDEMMVDLAQWGVVPTKTHTLTWPNLPDELLRHYLRGYFDGDGCFSRSSKARWRGSVNFRITSARRLLEGMQVFLMKACDLRATNIYQDKKLHKNIGCIQYGGRLQVTRIFDLMYDDATVWLPRKRDIIAPFLVPPPEPSMTLEVFNQDENGFSCGIPYRNYIKKPRAR